MNTALHVIELTFHHENVQAYISYNSKLNQTQSISTFAKPNKNEKFHTPLDLIQKLKSYTINVHQHMNSTI